MYLRQRADLVADGTLEQEREGATGAYVELAVNAADEKEGLGLGRGWFGGGGKGVLVED